LHFFARRCTVQLVPRPSPQTDRVIAVTRLLAAHPDEGFTISELARRLRLNKATLYPMVTALTEAGWLVRDPATKAFRLGPELIAVGEAAGRSLPAVQLARPAMVDLATELGVTCVAFTATDGVATLTDQVWDVRSTVPPLRVGLWAPLRAPFGLVFAAWADEGEVADWLDGADPSARPEHLAALQASRQRGYVVELRTPTRRLPDGTGSLADMLPAESEHGFLLADLDADETYPVSTIEAPVFNGNGRVALALVLVGVPRAMRGAEITAMGERLVRATRAVSASLVS
jgi:DNA-binding IclR family transcriptional regulator